MQSDIRPHGSDLGITKVRTEHQSTALFVLSTSINSITLTLIFVRCIWIKGAPKAANYSNRRVDARLMQSDIRLHGCDLGLSGL